MSDRRPLPDRDLFAIGTQESSRASPWRLLSWTIIERVPRSSPGSRVARVAVARYWWLPVAQDVAGPPRLDPRFHLRLKQASRLGPKTCSLLISLQKTTRIAVCQRQERQRDSSAGGPGQSRSHHVNNFRFAGAYPLLTTPTCLDQNKRSDLVTKKKHLTRVIGRAAKPLVLRQLCCTFSSYCCKTTYNIRL